MSPQGNTEDGVIISDEPRINDEIRVSQVRLIGPNGEQVGVIATSVALNLAKEANLDLVEVAPNAKPPVAKLIDYGKFKYDGSSRPVRPAVIRTLPRSRRSVSA